MDLLDFIRARLDDGEAFARNAFGEHNNAVADWRELWSGAVQVGPHEDPIETQDSQITRHIICHDPTRMLAEVTAKRRIVELAEEATGLDMQVDNEFRVGSRDSEAEPYVGDLILRLLALPFADHPDYDDSWRP